MDDQTQVTPQTENTETSTPEQAPLPEMTTAQLYEIQQQQTQAIITSALPEFEFYVNHMQRNELRRLVKLMAKFPFIDQRIKLNSQKEKEAFRLAEKIVYAKMSLFAREELKQTLEQIEKNQKAEENIKEGDKSVGSAEEK